MPKHQAFTPYYHYLHPRYWLSWLNFALMWLVTRLPFAVALSIGASLGTIIYYLPTSAKKIAAINIQQCFPELDKTEQHQLVKDHFISLGIGLVEVFLCWWNKSKFHNRVSWEGMDIIKKAHEDERPIILLTCHFTTLEIGGTLVNEHFPIAALYREQSNLLFNEVMNRSRMHNLDKIINRNDIRDLAKLLKNKGIVWYAPDQNYNGKQSVFANFFGLPAATTSATSRLAKMTNAVIIPFYQIRSKDRRHYQIKVGQPLANIPTKDPQKDTEIVNKAIEDMIKQAPEQYLWSHRRFKNLPDDITPLYTKRK